MHKTIEKARKGGQAEMTSFFYFEGWGVKAIMTEGREGENLAIFT